MMTRVLTAPMFLQKEMYCLETQSSSVEFTLQGGWGIQKAGRPFRGHWGHHKNVGRGVNTWLSMGVQEGSICWTPVSQVGWAGVMGMAGAGDSWHWALVTWAPELQMSLFPELQSHDKSVLRSTSEPKGVSRSVLVVAPMLGPVHKHLDDLNSEREVGGVEVI